MQTPAEPMFAYFVPSMLQCQDSRSTKADNHCAMQSRHGAIKAPAGCNQAEIGAAGSCRSLSIMQADDHANTCDADTTPTIEPAGGLELVVAIDLRLEFCNCTDHCRCEAVPNDTRPPSPGPDDRTMSKHALLG